MRPHMTVESQPGMGRPIVARIPEGFAADDGLETEPADEAESDYEGDDIAGAYLAEGAGGGHNGGDALVRGEYAHEHHKQHTYSVAQEHRKHALAKGHTCGYTRADHQRRDAADAAGPYKGYAGPALAISLADFAQADIFYT